MAEIRGIHHLALRVMPEQYNKTLDFYQNTMGLTMVHQWSAGTMLSAGNTIIEILKNGLGAENGGALNHFAFATDDVDGWVKKLQDAGYELTRGPESLTVPSEPPMPVRLAFFRGPAGESIEFTCEC